jgi:hypothetical protein
VAGERTKQRTTPPGGTPTNQRGRNRHHGYRRRVQRVFPLSGPDQPLRPPVEWLPQALRPAVITESGPGRRGLIFHPTPNGRWGGGFTGPKGSLNPTKGPPGISRRLIRKKKCLFNLFWQSRFSPSDYTGPGGKTVPPFSTPAKTAGGGGSLDRRGFKACFTVGGVTNRGTLNHSL